MAELSRKTRLCLATPPPVTGLDFIQVVDHTQQDVLLVFFLIDPQNVVDLEDETIQRFADATAGETLDETEIARLSIVALETGEVIEINSAQWVDITTNGETRQALEITVAEPGSAAIFTFSYDHEYIDRFFNKIEFSFKQGCPSGTDCKPVCQCPQETNKAIAIDYLARDFNSLRGALLDFAAQNYPEWEAKVEADQAMMLLEILAHLGDEFAYTQDRYAAEGYLDTATQRKSVAQLARLVDYEIDHGEAAQTELAFGVASGMTLETASGIDGGNPTRVFALREDVGAIPFEVTNSIWAHPDWNEIELYLADCDAPCLEIGATSAFLQIGLPDDAVTPEGTLEPERFWEGRRIFLRSGLGTPNEPNRSWSVTINRAEKYEDLLGDDGSQLCEIFWDNADALPFEMPILHARAYLNVASAIAGETKTKAFRVGSIDAVLSSLVGVDEAQERKIRELPKAIERESGCSTEGRGVTIRYGIPDSNELGIAWEPGEGGQVPRMMLHEVSPDLSISNEVNYANAAGALEWRFVETILRGDPEDRLYSLEHGLWQEVARFRKPEGDVVLGDYALGEGFTVRFGHQDFGISPAQGTIFLLQYLTAPGRAANLPADSVTRLARPDEQPPIGGLIWVTNPLPITNARPPESLQDIRTNAPEAYRAILLRAVKNEDFREILERREDVQQANMTSRWTGSWTTNIAAVDPTGTLVINETLRNSLTEELECVRQAGRQVCLRDPDYIAIDLDVEVCLSPEFSNAALVRNITEKLTKNEGAFFHPDNFTFGTPLIRSELEAEIQCIPGVRAVESIQARRRGYSDFEPMPSRLTPAAHQIFQLANDPGRPERGYLEVSVHGGG